MPCLHKKKNDNNNKKKQHLTTRRIMSASSSFPSTLAGFGYAFNTDGQLRQIDAETGLPGLKPFDFNISSDPAKNQKNYEALGDLITEEIYRLLEQNGLKKIYIPSDLPQEKATFIFVNRLDIKNTKKLMVLIHGSGVVRAGQWSRSLIINQSLNHGTQLPYIKKAIELGYDVIVTNTNDNYRDKKSIPKNSNPTEHGSYVWKKIILPANPQSVAIVGHSYGGVVIFDLAKKYKDFFKSKVFAIGLTDSVHSGSNTVAIYHDIARNWVTSLKPLNTPIFDHDKQDVPQISAGHTKHEWTSWACMDKLFEFVEDKYAKRIANDSSSSKSSSSSSKNTEL